VIARHDEHVTALEAAVLAQFTDRAPCRRKQRRPPSPAALAEAGRIRGQAPQPGQQPGQQVVIDFADYVAAANARSHARRTDGTDGIDEEAGR